MRMVPAGVDVFEVLYHAPDRVAHHSFGETLTLVERDRSPVNFKLYQVTCEGENVYD